MARSIWTRAARESPGRSSTRNTRRRTPSARTMLTTKACSTTWAPCRRKRIKTGDEKEEASYRDRQQDLASSSTSRRSARRCAGMLTAIGSGSWKLPKKSTKGRLAHCNKHSEGTLHDLLMRQSCTRDAECEVFRELGKVEVKLLEATLEAVHAQGKGGEGQGGQPRSRQRREGQRRGGQRI